MHRVVRNFIVLLLFLALVSPALAHVNESDADIAFPRNDSLVRGTISVNLTFAGPSNVTIEHNSTGAYVALDTSASQNGSYNASWATAAIEDGVYGLRVTIVNESDALDNVTLYASNITVDNTAPDVTNLTFSDHAPASNLTDVNVTVRVQDASGVSIVQLSTGAVSILLTDRIAGDAYDGIWNVTFPLSTLGCLDEAMCVIRVIAEDDAGNTNGSVNTTGLSPPVYVDSNAPIIIDNRTNASSATSGQNLTVSARWQDVVLGDPERMTVRFEFFDYLAGAFTDSFARLASWSVGQLASNYTNTTFRINGSDEGRLLTFRVTLNDSNGNATTSADLITTVGNVSANVTILSPANGTVVAQATPFLVQMLDSGIGVNASSLWANVSGDVNETISYAANASLFDCGCDSCGDAYDATASLHNVTCELDLSWVTGVVTVALNVSDSLSLSGASSYAFIVVDDPDIVNVTINGVQRTDATGEESYALNMTNASRQVNISWSVDADSAINRTGIRLLNMTPDLAQSFGTTVASVLYNLTAGRNYIAINATIDNSILNDTVQLNLTADVPLDLDALRDQYVRGMVTAWNVTIDGTDITGTANVNGTVELIVNVSNGTHSMPFSATLNFTGRDGLGLRWNATADAFTFTTGSGDEHAALGDETRGNVTVLLAASGQTELFFDGNEYRIAATFNVTNATPYYRASDATGNATYVLGACASVPAAAIGAEDSCYVDDGDMTMLYLPRFDHEDRVFFGEAGGTAPNVSILTNLTVHQSIIPLGIAVVTPSPNTTFCSFNLSRYNATEDVSVTDVTGSVSAGEFSTSGVVWRYDRNITGKADGTYNISVTCADSLGNTNTTTKSISVSDTTAPTILSAEAGGVSSDDATISATSDEEALFTVKYGTTLATLSTSVSGSETYGTSDAIDLEELSAGTRYFYNVTACDRSGNCGTSETLDLTTTSIDGGSGGGGGGADPSSPVAAPDGAAEETYTRVLFDVAAGSAIAYEPSGIALTKVELFFRDAAERAEITIEQFNGRPALMAGEPDAPGSVYKYLRVQHRGLDAVSDYHVEFSVPASWASAVDLGRLRLYRLEDGRWVGYTPERTGDTYRVRLPGFSYFAIAAPSIAADATDAPILEVAGEPGAPADPEEPAVDVIEESPSGEFVPSAENGFIPGWLLIPLLALLALGAAAVGLQQYRRYQERETTHRQELRQEHERYVAKRERPADHDPMRPIHDYIVRMRAAGHPEERIRAQLLSVGWDETVVDLELMRK